MDIKSLRGSPIVLLRVDEVKEPEPIYLTSAGPFDPAQGRMWNDGPIWKIPSWIRKLPHLKEVFSRPFITGGNNGCDGKETWFQYQYSHFKGVSLSIAEKYEIIRLFNLIPNGLYDSLNEVGAYIVIRTDERKEIEQLNETLRELYGKVSSLYASVETHKSNVDFERKRVVKLLEENKEYASRNETQAKFILDLQAEITKLKHDIPAQFRSAINGVLDEGVCSKTAVYGEHYFVQARFIKELKDAAAALNRALEKDSAGRPK